MSLKKGSELQLVEVRLEDIGVGNEGSELQLVVRLADVFVRLHKGKYLYMI